MLFAPFLLPRALGGDLMDTGAGLFVDGANRDAVWSKSRYYSCASIRLLASYVLSPESFPFEK